MLATQQAREQKSKGKVKSKVFHSNVPSIEQITIPLPPLDIQKRYKLKAFFEKYFGIGGSSTFTDTEHKTVSYDMDRQDTFSMVAESKAPYGKTE